MHRFLAEGIWERGGLNKFQEVIVVKMYVLTLNKMSSDETVESELNLFQVPSFIICTFDFIFSCYKLNISKCHAMESIWKMPCDPRQAFCSL